MTKNAQVQFDAYARLLKTDPIATAVRTSRDHDALMLGLHTAGFRVELSKRKVLTQADVFSDAGALVASGTSGDAEDALKQAIRGYFTEQVAARLA